MNTLSIQEVNGITFLVHKDGPNKYSYSMPMIVGNGYEKNPYHIGKKQVKVIDRPNHFIDSDIGKVVNIKDYSGIFRIIEVGVNVCMVENENEDIFAVEFISVTFIQGR